MNLSDQETFTEEEVEAIIRSALKLQGNKYSEFSGKPGISKNELFEIGEDIGLSKNDVERAVAKYTKGQHIQRSDITDTHISEEREFKTDLPEHVIWEETLDILNHHFGSRYGSVEEDSHKKIWRHNSIGGIETQLSLTKRGNSAKLRISQRVGLGKPISEGVSYGGILALILGFLHSAATNESSFYVFLGITFTLWVLLSSLIYVVDVKWRKNKQNALSALSNKIIESLPNEIDRRESIDSHQAKENQDEHNSSRIEIDSKDQYQEENKNSGSDSSGLKNQLKD